MSNIVRAIAAETNTPVSDAVGLMLDLMDQHGRAAVVKKTCPVPGDAELTDAAADIIRRRLRGADMTAAEWMELSRQEDALVDRCQEKARPMHGRRAQLYAMYALYEQGRQQAAQS